MTLALDISNYTSPTTADMVRKWLADGVGVVIIQAFPPTYHQFTQQSQQAQACTDAGMPFDFYVYDYLASPSWRDGCISGINTLHTQGHTARRLWSDVEDVDASAVALGVQGRVRAVDATLRALDLVPSRLNPTGVYSARGYWLGQWGPAGGLGNTPAFSDRPLWDAHYDHIADASVDFTPYGGWTQATIKQYAGTSAFDGVGGLDLDVLSTADALTLNPPTETQTMAITPGDGMVAQMHAHGDSPLFGHKFFSEVDDAGATYSVEQCYGAQGLYVSSNSSGTWVNAGPF